MRSTLKLMGLSLMISAVTFAAKIAVVDSGVDYKHPELSGKIWDNAGGTVTDADGKKYANVTQGWNFAENNNQVIDYKYLGTFSADCTKIFEVQAKILKEEASEEEIAAAQAEQAAQMAAMEMHMEHPELLTSDEGVPAVIDEAAPDNGENPYADQYVGRNDPCPCGSGKKYKQCHGRLA
mgnify:CR=1 FL=1